jgi:hypothetical protein
MRATMIFDNDVHLENDPRGEIKKFWDQIPARLKAPGRL